MPSESQNYNGTDVIMCKKLVARMVKKLRQPLLISEN